MNPPSILSKIVLLSATAAALSPELAAQDWLENTISPVANPLFFEDPRITSEIRPIFAYHEIGDDFITQGGHARYYALQARYAITDRLAIIATKDGYVELDPGNNAVPKDHGWADISAGLKYAVIDDREHQFILTPGLKIEIPVGERQVFQGNGKGEWDLFVSSAKGWGDLHLTGSTGVRLPNDWNEETAAAHYSLQLDYYTCQYFIPFVAGNGFTVLSQADLLPLDVEGFDLINFGSQKADGRSQVVFGTGFRSRLHASVDLGFAWETSVTDPQGLFAERFTVDLIWRF